MYHLDYRFWLKKLRTQIYQNANCCIECACNPDSSKIITLSKIINKQVMVTIIIRIEFGCKMSENMDTFMGECIEIVLHTDRKKSEN